jgi:hypothetical protein
MNCQRSVVGAADVDVDVDVRAKAWVRAFAKLFLPVPAAPSKETVTNLNVVMKG